MMTDGVKNKVDGKIEVKDIAELIVKQRIYNFMISDFKTLSENSRI